jgi:glycosyltransferase involved in cell wall biosynthesis
VHVAIIFDNFGPYHLARVRAAAEVCSLTAVEVSAKSADYAWAGRLDPGNQTLADFSGKMTQFKIVTLIEKGASEQMTPSLIKRRINYLLDEIQPQVVMIPGWADTAALAALQWCLHARRPAVMMSESTAWDETRKSWKEFIKGNIVSLAAAGFAGGTAHVDYLEQLGLTRERIFLGYDAVDNFYFEKKAAEIRKLKVENSKQCRLSEKYFLASNRFIEKKNLPRMIEAYAQYRKKFEGMSREVQAVSTPHYLRSEERKLPWDLVLLGDGALRQELEAKASDLGVSHWVHMPGFKQYPELPTYYANAGAFIHASTTEQWGLVVNEAMASGLPVLVSQRCGCTQDLVQDGVNGFTFDPYDTEEMAIRMFQFSNFPPLKLSEMGAASQRIIANWGPERFAQGLKESVDCALRVGPIKSTRIQRTILQMLLWR